MPIFNDPEWGRVNLTPSSSAPHIAFDTIGVTYLKDNVLRRVVVGQNGGQVTLQRPSDVDPNRWISIPAGQGTLDVLARALSNKEFIQAFKSQFPSATDASISHFTNAIINAGGKIKPPAAANPNSP